MQLYDAICQGKQCTLISSLWDVFWQTTQVYLSVAVTEFFRAVCSISSTDDSTVKLMDFISSLCVFLSWKAEQWQVNQQQLLHQPCTACIGSDLREPCFDQLLFSGGLSVVQRLLWVLGFQVLFRTREKLFREKLKPWGWQFSVGFVFGWFYFLEGESFSFSSSVDGFTGFWRLIVTRDFYFFQVKKLCRSCAQDFFARSICFNSTLLSLFLLHVCFSWMRMCCHPSHDAVVTIWLFKNPYGFISLYNWFPSNADFHSVFEMI